MIFCGAEAPSFLCYPTTLVQTGTRSYPDPIISRFRRLKELPPLGLPPPSSEPGYRVRHTPELFQSPRYRPN